MGPIRRQFTTQNLIFVNITPTPTEAGFKQIQSTINSFLRAPSPQITRTTRGILLKFSTPAGRWQATDTQTWLDTLSSTYKISVSERRAAIVLSGIPDPGLDWHLFAENEKCHKELHPKWFRFLEGLNPISIDGKNVVYRIRKVEKLAQGAKGLVVAVWFHDEEVSNWFLGKKRFQFGEKCWVNDVQEKRKPVCGSCGKRGHATRNCRESPVKSPSASPTRSPTARGGRRIEGRLGLGPVEIVSLGCFVSL